MSAKKTYLNWQLETDSQQILWLTFNRKDSSVNTLTRAVLKEFNEIVDVIANTEGLLGVVLQSGKSNGFIAGADIEQFTKLKTEEEAFELVRQARAAFDKWAALKIPTVAMIAGFCLGGGLELALASRYRVAEIDSKTKLGLPEVKLGIFPGWGGVPRLVNLIGVFKAMSLILTGRIVDAKTAAKLGFVDAAVPERELKRAAQYYLINKPKIHQSAWWDKLANISFVRPLVGKIFFHQLANKIKETQYPAPYEVVKLWIQDGAEGSQAALNESKAISKLFVNETCRNLIRVFFLQNRLKGLAKASDFNPQHVHVIGAGTMGGDIAAWCALRGLQVTLQDRAPEYIAPAIKRAYQLFSKKFKNDKRAIQAAMDRLMPDVQGLGIKRADVVIEAIFENLEAKHALYKVLEPQLKPGAILATNTSSLPLEELNKVLTKADLVGIHFFNPVAKMELVEVVKSDKTSDVVFKRALAFVRKIDRLPLPVKSSPGFLVNRILMPYLMEAFQLISEGVPAPVVDKAAVDFGMPMGPLELADVVGLDICLSVADVLTKHFNGEVPDGLRQMVKEGKLGRKSGVGFYKYKKGKKITVAIPKDEKVKDDITDRLILRMVNEAVACLREEVVEDADLVDVGMIFGTGFAPFHGGPMHYAITEGPDNIVTRLKHLQKNYGARFTPDEGWKAINSVVKHEHQITAR